MTINATTFKGFAAQFAKTLGTTKGFKPYWKNDQGKNFYGFVESFGIAGDAVKPFLTRFGYVIAHCDYVPKDQTVGAAQPNRLPAVTLSPNARPVLVKRTTPKAAPKAAPKALATIKGATLTRKQLDSLPANVQIEIYRTLNANGIAVR
jgi:hypothetical protein